MTTKTVLIVATVVVLTVGIFWGLSTVGSCDCINCTCPSMECVCKTCDCCDCADCDPKPCDQKCREN